MSDKQQNEDLESPADDPGTDLKEAKPEPTTLSVELPLEEGDFDAQTV